MYKKKKILTLLLILGGVLISGCVEEQVAQPKQEDKIITQNETVVSEEDTKPGEFTSTVDLDGYKIKIYGDASGPIGADFEKDDTAPLIVENGDKVAYFIGAYTSWHSIDVGLVINITGDNVTIDSTTSNGFGINKVPRNNILKILNPEKESAKVENTN